LEERRIHWNDRLTRFFAWNTPIFEQEKMPLRDRVRFWEQDELRKMEQERLAKKKARQALECFGRNVRGPDGMDSEQVDATDHTRSVGDTDQDRVNRGWRGSATEEGLNDTRRLTLEVQEDMMMGEVVYDREQAGHPRKLTTNRCSISVG
jgi:hypothetical protein